MEVEDELPLDNYKEFVPPTWNEARKALRIIRNNKDDGLDNDPGELLK